jgi:hypothetical protein
VVHLLGRVALAALVAAVVVVGQTLAVLLHRAKEITVVRLLVLVKWAVQAVVARVQWVQSQAHQALAFRVRLVVRVWHLP